MAQKVNVSLVDDLDGSPAAETVAIGLDGSSYEIDLSRVNAGVLRDSLAPYVAAGRKAGKPGRTVAPSRRRGRGRRPAGASAGVPSTIRAWGRENGWAVSERGRISAELTAAYRQAH
jgi:hypothetical protein